MAVQARRNSWLLVATGVMGASISLVLFGSAGAGGVGGGFQSRSRDAAINQISDEQASAADSPFRISPPGGARENLAGATGLDEVPAEINFDVIRRDMSATRSLAAGDSLRFRMTASEGRKNSNGFSSSLYYSDGVTRQLLTVGAWNKVGDFNRTVSPDSPVSISMLTTIDGLAALTTFPSGNVVGGLGPRTVFLYHAGTIYVLHGEGFFSDDSFMSVVHNFIGEVKK